MMKWIVSFQLTLVILLSGCARRESVPAGGSAARGSASAPPAERIAVEALPLFTLEGVGPDHWLQSAMTVRIAPKAAGLLRLSATAVNIQGQPADNALEVTYLGKRVASCDFVAGVEKECVVDLGLIPGAADGRLWRELVFKSKRQFVPKQLGINADTRSLSFQVGKITLAEKPPFLVDGVSEDKWMLAEMKIRVDARARGTLIVTARPVLAPHQPTDNALEVFYEGKLLQTCEFTGMEKNCDVALSQLTGKDDLVWHELRFKSRRQFVPKNLGVSGDTRALSFQIEKISVIGG